MFRQCFMFALILINVINTNLFWIPYMLTMERNCIWIGDVFTPMQKKSYQLMHQNHLGMAYKLLNSLTQNSVGTLTFCSESMGILIYLNRAPIIWYGQKQKSVETLTFCSEFMALKVGIKLVKGL